MDHDLTPNSDSHLGAQQEEKVPLFSFAHEAASDPTDEILKKDFNQAASKAPWTPQIEQASATTGARQPEPCWRSEGVQPQKEAERLNEATELNITLQVGLEPGLGL